MGLTVLFSQHLKDIVSFPLIFHSFWWNICYCLNCSFSIGEYHFSLAALKTFFIVFSFQGFNSDVSWHGFLSVYLAWGWLILNPTSHWAFSDTTIVSLLLCGGWNPASPYDLHWHPCWGALLTAWWGWKSRLPIQPFLIGEWWGSYFLPVMFGWSGIVTI